MVPEGWQQVQVGDTCTFQNGHGFTPEVWDTQGLPIIRIQNLNGSQNFNYFSGVPEDRWLVKPGDMLFAWAGTKGVSFGPTIWRGDIGVLNQHIFKVFCANGVDRNWLYLCLRHVTDLIEVRAHGFKATLVHVKKSDIERQPVLLPPLPEQQKIAGILGTWDKAIETTEALLANARTQKRALMQSLLTGTRRFPGFEDHPWREVRLGDVAEVAMGSSPKSEAYNSDGIGLPLIQGNADIKDGRSSPRSFTSEITQTCKPGDILMSVRAPVGTVAVSDHEACVGRGAAVIGSKTGTDWDWLFQQMKFLEDKWARVSQGSTFDAVNGKEIRDMPVHLPKSLDEQRRIGGVLRGCDVEDATLSAHLNHLRIEKKSLMQQLLTGKRRVAV